MILSSLSEKTRVLPFANVITKATLSPQLFKDPHPSVLVRPRLWIRDLPHSSTMLRQPNRSAVVSVDRFVVFVYLLGILITLTGKRTVHVALNGINLKQFSIYLLQWWCRPFRVQYFSCWSPRNCRQRSKLYQYPMGPTEHLGHLGKWSAISMLTMEEE